MGGLMSKPKPPKVPKIKEPEPPAVPPPTRMPVADDASIREQTRLQRERAFLRRGRRSTIMTDSIGSSGKSLGA